MNMYDFEQQYKKGIEMPADILSRQPVNNITNSNSFREHVAWSFLPPNGKFPQTMTHHGTLPAHNCQTGPLYQQGKRHLQTYLRRQRLHHSPSFTYFRHNWHRPQNTSYWPRRYWQNVCSLPSSSRMSSLPACTLFATLLLPTANSTFVPISARSDFFRRREGVLTNSYIKFAMFWKLVRTRPPPHIHSTALKLKLWTRRSRST